MKTNTTPWIRSIGVLPPALMYVVLPAGQWICMPLRVSVCIPACNRPALLKLAIESCLLQRRSPLEIVIGDDSHDDACGSVARSIVLPDGVALDYRRNDPPVGQAANVNQLFDRATGACILLLHDDDVLCAGALEQLVQAWERWPGTTCVYGRQEIVDLAGKRLVEASEAWNERYFRVTSYAGPQDSPLVAALRQQVPNDGYLVDARLARTTRCRPESEVGQCVDADFAIRMAQRAADGSFVFVDAVTSQYRLTPASIARSKTLNRREDLLFEAVESIAGGKAVQDAKDVILGRIAVGASLDAALAARRRFAVRIILSRHYTRPMLSRWTLYRFLCAAAPSIGPQVKRLIEAAGLPAVDERGMAQNRPSL